VPLLTERTVARHAKADRWQKLALAAMKQCGRSVLPAVSELTSMEKFLTETIADRKIIAHESAPVKSSGELNRPADAHRVALLVGPEGGFTEQEIEAAAKSGFIPVSLGSRRLRSETAAIVISALVLQHKHQGIST
jgi:16S rRNA (uracil1498-N3)-methyltransferase